MTAQHDTADGGPPPDDDAQDLRALLSAEADRYRPDRDAIMNRLATAGNGPGRVPRPWRSRPVVPVLAAASVTALLVGVGVALDGSAGRSAPAATDAASLVPSVLVTGTSPATSPSPNGPTETPRPSETPRSPSASGRSGSATAAATSSGGGPRTTYGPTSSRGEGTPSVSLGAPGLSTAQLPSMLTLGPASGRDWLVAGSRSDGRLIRLTNGSGTLSLEDETGKASDLAAPVDVRWSGGAPEQGRTVNGTWWCATPTTVDAPAFSLQVGALAPDAVLQLYVGPARGSSGAGSAKIEARVDGGKLGQLHAGAGVVSIVAPSGSSGRRLFVQVSPTARDGRPSGAVCLAAAVLR